MNAEDSDVWKWVAGILATLLTALLLSAIPALLFVLHTPSRNEVDLIRDRQQTVLQRLAADDVLIASLVQMDQTLLIRVDALQDELHQHQANDLRRRNP